MANDGGDRKGGPGGYRDRKGGNCNRPSGDRGHREYGNKPRGDKPRGDKLHGNRGGPRGGQDRRLRSGERRDRPREQPRTFNREPQQEEPRRLPLSQDPSKLLYKGIDCQISGRTDLAMIMFLHGAVLLSEGCEKNADRILKETGKDGASAMRENILPQCTDDALTEFDYLCIKRFKGYDRTFFDKQYAEKSTHAIYRRIFLEEVEGNDPVIDDFASRYPDDPDKVVKGLEYERRKKDSPSSEAHLKRIEEAEELKRSVYVKFTRAMNGDARAARELKDMSKKVPEAAFFSEYLVARAEGTNVEWLRSKYDVYKDLIISKQGEFKIQDTPFGMFLRAKSLQKKNEDWMPVMMNAAKAGCQEAVDELSTKMFRNDVRKCLAGIYLKNGDIPALISVYQAGLDDMYYLDQYCGDDKDRVLEVGKALGELSIQKEIDWLKDHCDKGMDFCRDALMELSSQDRYRCKKMIYALHDVGADMDAAKLYFAMEGDPEAPSVKWLKKVCGDDEVKEFVRAHYAEAGRDDVFDSIFEDDGYEHRPRKQQRGGRFQGRSGGRSFGKPSGRPRRRD